jgi:hypothetical protein
VVEPLLRHLGDEQRRLFDLLPGHDESGVGDAHVQPLPQDQLLVTKLGITQKLEEIDAFLMEMSEIVNFFSWSNPLELCSDNFSGWLWHLGGINKNTVWLDGTRPPPKYVFKNNLSLTNSKI